MKLLILLTFSLVYSPLVRGGTPMVGLGDGEQGCSVPDESHELLDDKCAVKAVENIFPDLNSYITGVDFQKQSVPRNSEELKNFYHGTPTSCIKCSGVSSDLVEQVQREILILEIARKKKIAQDILMEALSYNHQILKGRDFKDLSSEEMGKLSCLTEIKSQFADYRCYPPDEQGNRVEQVLRALTPGKLIAPIMQMSTTDFVTSLDDHLSSLKKDAARQLAHTFDEKKLIRALKRTEAQDLEAYCLGDLDSLMPKSYQDQSFVNPHIQFLLSRRAICKKRDELISEGSSSSKLVRKIFNSLEDDFKDKKTEILLSNCDHAVASSKGLICQREMEISEETFAHILGRQELGASVFESYLNSIEGNADKLNAMKALACYSPRIKEAVAIEQDKQERRAAYREKKKRRTASLLRSHDSKSVEEQERKTSSASKGEERPAESRISRAPANPNPPIPIENNTSRGASTLARTNINIPEATKPTGTIERLLDSPDFKKDEVIQNLRKDLAKMSEEKRSRLLGDLQSKYDKLEQENKQLREQNAKSAVVREQREVNETSIAALRPSSARRRREPASISPLPPASEAAPVVRSTIPQAFPRAENAGPIEIKNYLTAELKSSAAPVITKDLYTKVGKIIADFADKNAISKMVIEIRDGKEELVIGDTGQHFELEKFEKQTRELIRRYVKFLQSPEAVEKRGAIFDLSANSQAINVESLKQALRETIEEQEKTK